MEYNFLRCTNREGKVLAMMTSLMVVFGKVFIIGMRTYKNV